MTTSAVPLPPPLPADDVPNIHKTLRRLFLTLFLRGRSSRGLQKENAPSTIGGKLFLVLLLYFLFGLLSLIFIGQPVFALSIYMHGMTFAFLGMFLASSVGEVLFNKEEADILLHRPITPRTLLWAKIRVLLESSLWLAGAFNLISLVVGAFSSDSNILFIPVHVLSIALEALFCAGCVVLCYQLCLRWFGRELLDNLITAAQVIVSIAAVLSGQILPQLIIRARHITAFSRDSWWPLLLPPAWFAGLDDAVAGSMALSSWLLAMLAFVVTAFVLWLAFAKLGRDYDTSLSTFSETISRKRSKGARRRWINILAEKPPLRWWLRDPISRASFLLVSAYLLRDRDVKLRVYPAIAPILILPIMMLLNNRGDAEGLDGFMAGLIGGYIALIPLMTLNLLQFSQQWQAADIFRAAPMTGPAPLCHGARRAVMLVITFPLLCVFAFGIWAINRDFSQLFMILPGTVALPVFAISSGFITNGVPLSMPTEEAKAASRGLSVMGAAFAAMILGGISGVAWSFGWFQQFMLVECIGATLFYVVMRMALNRRLWPRIET